MAHSLCSKFVSGPLKNGPDGLCLPLGILRVDLFDIIIFWIFCLVFSFWLVHEPTLYFSTPLVLSLWWNCSGNRSLVALHYRSCSSEIMMSFFCIFLTLYLIYTRVAMYNIIASCYMYIGLIIYTTSSFILIFLLPIVLYLLFSPLHTHKHVYKYPPPPTHTHIQNTHKHSHVLRANIHTMWSCIARWHSPDVTKRS